MRTMLSVITLDVLDKILQSVKGKKIPSQAQMLYINNLIHHFRQQPAEESAAHAFKIFISEIKNYELHKPNYEQLDKAGLVSISKNTVFFNNFWSPFIPKENFAQTQSKESGKPQLASQFKADLLNESAIELFRLKYKISKARLEKLVQIFSAEQDFHGKTYADQHEAAKHFSGWMTYNHSKVTNVETVVSTNNLIGY